MKVAYAIALPFAIGLAIASLSQLAAAGSPDPSFAGHIDAMVNQGLAAQPVADKAGPAGTDGQGGIPIPASPALSMPTLTAALPLAAMCSRLEERTVGKRCVWKC